MVALKAFAKINIGLKILNKRPDGYHNIETIFHRVNLCDTLELYEYDKLDLEIENANLPSDDRNICTKTLKLFQNSFGIHLGIKIKLIKNIPIGAGLGGGSSDAAVLLKALPEFFHIEVHNDDLKKIAQQLGADVPYFLENGSAYATEIGNKLEYFTLKLPYWIITITPPIHISTKWAYENLKNTIHEGNNNLKYLLLNNINNNNFLRENIINDFEQLIFQEYPEIKSIKEKLYHYGADFALLSGSGSTVFAFCKDEQLIKKLYETFKVNNFVSITEPYFEI